jgi:hypothetical protein
MGYGSPLAKVSSSNRCELKMVDDTDDDDCEQLLNWGEEGVERVRWTRCVVDVDDVEDNEILSCDKVFVEESSRELF